MTRQFSSAFSISDFPCKGPTVNYPVNTLKLPRSISHSAVPAHAAFLEWFAASAHLVWTATRSQKPVKTLEIEAWLAGHRQGGADSFLVQLHQMASNIGQEISKVGVWISIENSDIWKNTTLFYTKYRICPIYCLGSLEYWLTMRMVEWKSKYHCVA